MKLNPEKTAFGRHETFPLRFSWLPKGVQALERDPKVFESEDATVRLGVGRNMVNAIKYWLRASQMVSADSYEFTDLCTELLSSKGFDPYLEDEGTIWLLHWLVASNANLSTSMFWFFNYFQKREFSSEELQTALNDFLEDQLPKGKRPAKNTIRADAAVILRMYTQSKIVQRMPLEDVLDSPFALLKLVQHKSNEKVFVSRLIENSSVPLEVLGFSVVQTLREREVNILPIEDLMYCNADFAAPGSVFRLTENEFIRKLEQLAQSLPNSLEIRESSGIHQVFLLDEDLTLLDFISRYYGERNSEEAA
jgi:hypothetical protein